MNDLLLGFLFYAVPFTVLAYILKKFVVNQPIKPYELIQGGVIFGLVMSLFRAVDTGYLMQWFDITEAQNIFIKYAFSISCFLIAIGPATYLLANNLRGKAFSFAQLPVLAVWWMIGVVLTVSGVIYGMINFASGRQLKRALEILPKISQGTLFLLIIMLVFVILTKKLKK